MKRQRVDRMYGILDLESDMNHVVSQMTLLKCVIDDENSRTRVESVYIWILDPVHYKTQRLLESVHEYQIDKVTIRYTTIDRALQDLCTLVTKNRYIPIVSHAHDRDIEALVHTDRVLNGGFFREDGTAKSRVWERIERVCSQMLIRDMCPNYWEEYIRPRVPDTFCDCTLETHVKLMFNRSQKHVSYDDCMDLFHLLRILFRTDGPRTMTHLFKNVKGVHLIQHRHGGRTHRRDGHR